MKVEFNGNGFSTNMGGNNSTSNNGHAQSEQVVREILEKKPIKNFLPLVLGIIALVIALVLIPFGLIATTATTSGTSTFLFELFDLSQASFVMAYIFMILIVALISCTLGIIACVVYAKSDKKGVAMAGLAVSILSFVVVAMGMTYNIIAIVLNML